MQPEPQVGVSEILGLRHGAHVEEQTVVGLHDLPDERQGRENGTRLSRHLRQERQTLRDEAPEPTRPHAPILACRCQRRPCKIAPRIEPAALQPEPRLRRRPLAGDRARLRRQPVEVERRAALLVLPFDAHRRPLQGCVSDPGADGEIRDVDQTLTIPRIAVGAEIVAQPDAGKLDAASLGRLNISTDGVQCISVIARTALTVWALPPLMNSRPPLRYPPRPMRVP